MRKILMILLCCFMLAGCGSNEVKETENKEKNDEKEMENEDETEYIDGFEKAKYEKFNSYASENGLDGTLICVEGKIISQANLKDDILSLAIVVEQEDGNRWCVGVPFDSEITEIEDKNVRIFGTYMGFSDLMNLPGMAVVVEDTESMVKARIEVEENGEYKEVWNFYDDYAKAEIEKLEESENPEEIKENLEEDVKSTEETEPPEENSEAHIPTMGEKNALSKAKDYLEFTAFSYSGLIEQLEYEKFSHEEAVYGADNCGADWNEQAVLKAKSYLEFSSFSKEGLIEQLEYEGFTHEQAVYGAEQNGY